MQMNVDDPAYKHHASENLQGHRAVIYVVKAYTKLSVVMYYNTTSAKMENISAYN